MLTTRPSYTGAMIVLPDGRCFRFIWSGTIATTRAPTFIPYPNARGRTFQECRRCSREFAVSELHYNRRSPGARKKPRLYCIGCAVRLGLIEECSGYPSKQDHSIDATT